MLSCSVRCLTLDDHWLLCSLLSLLLLVDGDHLQGAQDLGFELRPLDDGIVELNLGQVDEHSSDLWSLHLADKLLDVLVDGVADDVLFGLAIWSLLVLLGGEHVSDLDLIRSRIFSIDELWTLSTVLAASKRRELAQRLWLLLLTMHLLRVHRHLMLDHVRRGLWWRRSELVWLLLLLRIWIHRMVPRHHVLMMAAHLVLVVVAMALVVMVVMMTSIRTLVIASIVLVSRLHLEVASGTCHLILVHHLAVALRWVVRRVERVRPPLLVGHASIIDLEGRLEEKREEVDEVLRTVETLDLLLVLLVLFAFLSLAVEELFVADGSHLFGVAVFNIERVLTLEKYVPCKVFCHATLILLLEVDKGLLCAWDHVDAAHFTLACS